MMQRQRFALALALALGVLSGSVALQAFTPSGLLEIHQINVQQGSGKRAEVPGYRVGGKTGTAEKVVNGKYSKSALLTSFLGAFPMDAPEYLVYVLLDEPQRVEETGYKATAGLNAAPTVGRIIERIGPMLGCTGLAQFGRLESLLEGCAISFAMVNRYRQYMGGRGSGWRRCKAAR